MANSNKGLKRILSLALPAFLFVIILGYTYYKTKNLLGGVILKVDGITDGQGFDSPEIKLFGSAKNATLMTINGREIFVDKDANFEEKLLLLPGYNIIEVKAEDKFGKKIQKDYQLTLK